MRSELYMHQWSPTRPLFSSARSSSRLFVLCLHHNLYYSCFIIASDFGFETTWVCLCCPLISQAYHTVFVSVTGSVWEKGISHRKKCKSTHLFSRFYNLIKINLFVCLFRDYCLMPTVYLYRRRHRYYGRCCFISAYDDAPFYDRCKCKSWKYFNQK